MLYCIVVGKQSRARVSCVVNAADSQYVITFQKWIDGFSSYQRQPDLPSKQLSTRNSENMKHRRLMSATIVMESELY